MPSSRALFLKGILGVAGLGVTGAGGIGLGLGKTFTEGKKDQATPGSNDEPANNQQGINIEVDKDADLGFPKECEGSCSLTEKQLKNLKFEQKGNEEIKFEGLKDGDEFELTIEESEDQINYPKGKKYTLKPKTISEQVTIKNIKEEDIVLENSKEVLIREISSGGKLEHLLEEVDRLGIPKRCKADEVTGEALKTCDLTQLQLQKLKFETREKEKITVEGLDEGNIVTLKIEDKGGDRDNYPQGKKYTLRSATGPITIKGVKEEDITLEANQDVLIRETTSGGKLEHLLEEVDRLGIPRRCKADEVTSGTPKTTCDLIKKQLKDLKFEPKEGSSISVEDQNEKSTFELTIEDKKGDTDNYPLGKKYTLKSKGSTAKIKGVKEGNIDIWGNQSVVIREKEEGGKLERAPGEVDDLGIPIDCKVSCHLTEQQLEKLKFETKDGEKIKVEFPNNAKTVNLAVEDKSNDRENYPKGKKYILTLKTSLKTETVTIKGLKEGDITIGSKGVVIREKQTGGKLEKAPEEIDNLGIPRSCTSTCELTKEQFKKLKFETNPGSSISIDGLSGNDDKVKLKVETQSNVIYYPKGKKYTLTSTSGQVTIQNAKEKDIVLEANKGVVFRETSAGNKLETYLNVLGIPRPWGGEKIKKGSNPEKYCLSSDQLKDLRFKNFEGEKGDVTVEGLDWGETIPLTISWDNNKNNYPDNKKYSFDNSGEDKKDIKITKGGVEVKIAKQTESWFGNNEGKLTLAEIKTKDQIAKENELAELKGILKDLGFEGLQIGYLVSDISNSKKRSQTNIELKNADDLKKIQFKDLEGGATDVTSLRFDQKITVYLDWEQDTKKFPKNMKFSFNNQRSSSFEFKKKGKRTISIPQRTVANPTMPTFKIEKYQNKWYLVKA